MDGTMGAGGHASAVLRAHPEVRAFVGLDVDPTAHDIAPPRIRAAAAGSDTSLEFVHANFRGLREALSSISPGLADGGVDGILLDLGGDPVQA